MRAVFRYTAACCAGCPGYGVTFKKILRESRNELLKPLLFIAEFCRRETKERIKYESDND